MPADVLDDLRRRLAATRWPESGPGGWEYGADLGYVAELCAYWGEGYDWRAQEARLNALPQFICEVDGLDLHYWHVRSGAADALPLLLVHGWPGSMFEYYELIEPLARAGYDIVVPSLPGFGFGGKPSEPGWGVARTAGAFHSLMTDALGYRRYGVHGGDWGAILAAWLGATRAGLVAAIHVTVASAARPPDEPSAADEQAVAERLAYRLVDGTHSFVQAARPDALTVGQVDSPAGLAAWIVQRFRSWSGCGGELERSFSKDTLLTNLMFYWAPASAASAARLYYEARAERARPHPHVEAPTALALFRDEPFRFPRAWAERAYNVVRTTELPRGGHFAALEEPELLLDDVTAFFATVA